MKIDLKKFKWIQILFLFVIFYGILKSKNEKVHYINKENDTYKIMKNHLIMNDFRTKLDKNLELLLNKSEFKEIKMRENIIETFINENNLEYFYIYYSENIVVYFFKKEKNTENQNSEIDKIYFEGLRKIQEIKNFSLPKIIKNKGILCIQDKILEEKGVLIKLENNNLKKIGKQMDLINVFLYFKKYIYLKKLIKNNNENENKNKNDLQNFEKNINEKTSYSFNDKYHIEIEGFSLGGLYSQLFLYKLYTKNLIDDCQIDYINIESWFGGDKNKFEEFNKITKIKNIMTFGSLFYLYNKFLQKYNNINEAIYIDDTDEMIFMKYIKQPFPYGIIDYVKNYHLIREFLPKIE